MSQIYYLMGFTLVFSIFLVFAFIVYSFVSNYQEYHWLSFVDVGTGYQIKEIDNWADRAATWAIQVPDIPSTCDDEKMQDTIYCLRDLRDWWWYYNDKWFPGDEISPNM